MDNTRKNLFEQLEREVKSVLYYSHQTIGFLEEEKFSRAWKRLEFTKTAYSCCIQLHEQLWNLTQGEFTDEEWELLGRLEEVSNTFHSTYKKFIKIRKEKNEK